MSKYKKYFEANKDLFESLNRNQTRFAEQLKANYPKDFKNTPTQTIRKGIGEYLKDAPLPELDGVNPIDAPKDIASVITDDRKVRALASQLHDFKRKNDHLLSQLEIAERAYDDLLSIKEPVDVMSINPSGKSSLKKSRATPIIQLSDWHVEEKVELGVVNGFNEYNLKIAEQRAIAVTKNSLKIIRKEAQDVNINDAIIQLGGDFLTGYIHDELIENNYLSPLEATRFVKRLLRWSIDYYLNNSTLNLIFPCTLGNHARTTKKMQPSTSYKNNYEYMLYCDLQDYYQGNKRVKFHIPTSDDCYVESYGKINRFFHGEQVKYGGGIGGLSIPLIKFIMRKDAQMKADHTFMCHYHTLGYVHGVNCCVNGSLIGLSAYGYKSGFKPEVPAQSFTLLDEKRGYTVKVPIFAE
jgi:hypothetical protein